MTDFKHFKVLHKSSSKKPEEEKQKWEEEEFGRYIEKNEIIIEDLSEEDLLNVASKMNKQKDYYLEYWKSPKQKSGHLHIKNINLPKDISILLSSKYKELIIKKYVREDLWDKVDWNFYNRGEGKEPHRIVTENTEHYKGYGKKILVKSWGKDKINPLEENILIKAEEQQTAKIINEKDITGWDELVKRIIPHWKEGKRQNLCLSVAGYLRKNKRLGIESTKSIISKICAETKDKEISMRLRAVDETYKKDEQDIKGISGLEFLQNQNPKDEKEIITKPENIFTPKGQAESYIKEKPIFYDKSGLWWMWNLDENFWEKVDEVDILNMIEESTGQDVITPKNRTIIINSLKQSGRKKIPKKIKPTWIQFKNIIVDIKTGEKFPANPKYFVTNPIPWELSKYENTPIMDKIFEEWVGKEYIKTLYEIIAYCLLSNYPIHRIFCFIGEGMNGKSKFLELLRKFIGEKNVCSTELDTLLTSRFEITRLHKKLVCQMGETNFNEMSKTSILKKLSGGDLIGYEYKRADLFEEINYAKILISTNNLPTTTDKTIGFYRRWCIIDFPNRFSEKKEILEDIPEEEYGSLAAKCLIILKDLLKKREFSKEGTIEERMKKYEDKSDPLEKFIKEYTEDDINLYIWKNEFEKKLNQWCQENRFRIMSSVAIGKKMKEKGIEQAQKYEEWMGEYGKKGGRAWIGIKWRSN